jgi:hypothetical protein
LIGTGAVRVPVGLVMRRVEAVDDLVGSRAVDGAWLDLDAHLLGLAKVAQVRRAGDAHNV